MAEKKSAILRWCRRYRESWISAGVILLVLVGMIALFFHANDKKPQAVLVQARAENEGSMIPEDNPLEASGDKEINLAVLKYYKRLSEHEGYVENYEDFNIYSKCGRYENTYIVFVTYKMKIKDIYTPVPGLGTLYVEREEDGGISINAQVEEQWAQEMIAQVTRHEDVRQLFENVEAAYKEAVQSDAMLAEALQDLQNAVQHE